MVFQDAEAISPLFSCIGALLLFLRCCLFSPLLLLPQPPPPPTDQSSQTHLLLFHAPVVFPLSSSSSSSFSPSPSAAGAGGGGLLGGAGFDNLYTFLHCCSADSTEERCRVRSFPRLFGEIRTHRPPALATGKRLEWSREKRRGIERKR